MSIEKYFTDTRFLSSVLPGYRTRSSQIEAAKIIDSSFASFTNAIIEAPTGSGKTMAYLIPAFDCGRKTLIATKTKQLMSQLLFKDIPSVQKFLGRGFIVKALKGRKNYFCPERFYRLVMPKAVYYPDAVNWYEAASNDVIREAPYGKLDGEVINLLTADRFQCKGSKCPYYESCPFYVAKAEANAADIIVTNHHLVLSDMAVKSGSAPGGVFDFRDHAIFDEAHAIPDIFAQYAGAELSLFGLTLFFRENRDKFSLGALESVQDAYFKILPENSDGRLLYDSAREKVADFIALCSSLTEEVKDDTMKEEFGRYMDSFEGIEGAEDGLRVIEKSERRITVKFIPFEAGDTFAAGLKKSVISSVFISATISSGGNFDYFMKEAGLSAADCVTAKMPAAFDFKSQAKLYVPKWAEIREKDALYSVFLSKIKGSVLVICNSLERMRRVGELLKFAVRGKKVLFQTDVSVGSLDMSGDMILVGCASLREGIDLSGGSFGCVVLDKLPFEYFKDLFLKSKAEKVQREEGNPFMHFFLPRAVLYFKQAAGRLIRHEEDKGVWAVFDERILTEKYGKYFLDVLDNVDVLRSYEEALKFMDGGNYGKADVRL